jgi:transposase
VRTCKGSHTIAAVAAATGEVLGEKTAAVGARGFDQVLRWARGLGPERGWALEDCRHVSGSFERFLIARGERVVRAPTRLMATSRRSSRERQVRPHRRDRGCARRAGRGHPTLPTAELAGPELDLRLLVDHRERLVRARVGLNNTLQWHLHDLWPELELPGSSLLHGTWGPRIARRLARAEQTMRVRIARDQLRRLRELTQAIKQLETEIAELVAQIAPQLLAEPGFGPLTAAKLVGEIAGAARFSSDAKLARAAAWHRSRSAPVAPTATGSIAAATARSTPPFTASRSPGRAVTPKRSSSSRARRPKARPTARPSGRSSVTSPAASGSCCAGPTRCQKRRPPINPLTKEQHKQQCPARRSRP